MKRIYQTILRSFRSAIPKAVRTSWWLLKMIIPISFAVSILQHYGIISIIAGYLTPLFSIIGLPGEASIVFMSSLFSPLYAPIAIIATLTLDMREITILALMCLISHNLFVESAIQQKTGSSYLLMFSLRLLMSFAAAFILNLILPSTMGNAEATAEAIVHSNLGAMLIYWAKGAGILSLKITLIISALMLLQSLLKEFKILYYLSKSFAPIMKAFGLSPQSSFLWLVAQFLGLTYGAAVLLEEVHNGEILAKDAKLLNYHIAINHSLLEDTLLFVAIGVPALWITFPRITFAIIVVWIVRIFTSRHQT